MASPEPVGNGTVGAHRLPPVQEEILPQNMNQQFIMHTVLFVVHFYSANVHGEVAYYISEGVIGKICHLFHVNNQL